MEDFGARNPPVSLAASGPFTGAALGDTAYPQPSAAYHFPLGRPLAERLGYPAELLDQIARLTNNATLTGLFGDSSYIVGYLRRLGYPAELLDRIPAEALASFAGVGYALDLAGLTPGRRVLDQASGQVSGSPGLPGGSRTGFQGNPGGWTAPGWLWLSRVGVRSRAWRGRVRRRCVR